MSDTVIDEAVILAAGRGTRLNSEYSSILPKSLVPVNDAPIISYVLNLLKRFELRRIYVVVGYKKNLIIDYLKKNYEDEEITFIQQMKLTGIADALLLTKNYIKGNYFIAVLGDTILDLSNVSEFYHVLDKYSPIAIEGVTKDTIEAIKRACEVSFDKDSRIKYCNEKPPLPQSNYRGIGFYIFNSKVFNYIEQTPVSSIRNEREITDTINIIAKLGKAYAVNIEGRDFNINTKEDLNAAKVWLATNYGINLKSSIM
jgi:bifunctional UDP-N-acetylglucosamine pyrophosphorylase/glucosamine-1-phosphate N-acetyltransferase